jgi:hypothetical protein
LKDLHILPPLEPEGKKMKKRLWFRTQGAAGASDPFVSTLLRLLIGSSSGKPATAALAKACPGPSSSLDSGAEACWTASLRRGDDLPPCRLSILIASGASSAMRLEPFRREAETGSRIAEL